MNNIPNNLRLAAQSLLNYASLMAERDHGVDCCGDHEKVARIASVLLSNAETLERIAYRLSHFEISRDVARNAIRVGGVLYETTDWIKAIRKNLNDCAEQMISHEVHDWHGESSK